jgi:methyltransferase (TIGR00027 family)
VRKGSRRSPRPKRSSGSGFDASKRTFWLVEGLLVYLEETAVDVLFRRIDALSASGSRIVFDASSNAILRLPMMAARLAFVAKLGAPWIFGLDDPEAFAAKIGWRADVTEHGEIGARFGRWPFPVAPPGVRGVPRSHLIEMTKP